MLYFYVDDAKIPQDIGGDAYCHMAHYCTKDKAEPRAYQFFCDESDKVIENVMKRILNMSYVPPEKKQKPGELMNLKTLFDLLAQKIMLWYFEPGIVHMFHANTVGYFNAHHKCLDFKNSVGSFFKEYPYAVLY